MDLPLGFPTLHFMIRGGMVHGFASSIRRFEHRRHSFAVEDGVSLVASFARSSCCAVLNVQRARAARLLRTD